jgi:hypothetical protein
MRPYWEVSMWFASHKSVTTASLFQGRTIIGVQKHLATAPYRPANAAARTAVQHLNKPNPHRHCPALPPVKKRAHLLSTSDEGGAAQPSLAAVMPAHLRPCENVRGMLEMHTITVWQPPALPRIRGDKQSLWGCPSLSQLTPPATLSPPSSPER